MRKQRPTVSMTMAIWRLATWASELGSVSRCAWVAAAILEKFERDGIEAVPEGWTPARRRGGPKMTKAQRLTSSEGYFPAVITL